MLKNARNAQFRTILGCGLLPRFLRRVVLPTFECKAFALEISNLEPSSDEMYEVTGGLGFDAAEYSIIFHSYKTAFVVVVLVLTSYS
jgi:hypothetical protein